MEASGGIGTTKRGIGQAYAYKAMRKSLRFEDLLNLAGAKKKLENMLLNWVEYARKKQDKRVILNEQVFYIYNFDNDNVIGGL